MTHVTPDATWESLRPSDGSDLKYSFSWYDDHSSWRLEELRDDIAEATSLLSTSGATPAAPDHLHDLKPIVNSLRALHRDERVTDPTIRRALALADELDISDWVEGDDANHEYECVIDAVNEAIALWQDHQVWVHTDDDWDVPLEREFTRCRDRRDGLGEHWTISFSDDVVELPDGTTVHGLRPTPAQQKLFDEIVYDHTYVDDSDKAAIAAVVMTTPDSITESVAQAVCDLAAGRRLDADAAFIAALTAIVTRRDTEEFTAIIETASRLAESWNGSEAELVAAAESLVCS